MPEKHTPQVAYVTATVCAIFEKAVARPGRSTLNDDDFGARSLKSPGRIVLFEIADFLGTLTVLDHPSRQKSFLSEKPSILPSSKTVSGKDDRENPPGPA
jgi:hypothetical protein